MPTNEPSDLPVDCTVEMTQQPDVPDYRTSAPPAVEAEDEGASVQPDKRTVENSDTASGCLTCPSAVEADGSASKQGEYSRLFLGAMVVAIAFTFIATLLSGTLQGLIAGFSLSGLLTAFWAFLNYKICKANKTATVSPMRCLAMSVFANQFGVTHAALFASAVLELIFPVLRTIRPPDIAMTFATYAGNVFAFIVVLVVAVLTVWWQVILAKKVYGARSRASILKAVSMGCLFAATSIWLLVNAGASDFYTSAPIAVNCCFVFVFFLARLIIAEPVPAGSAVPATATAAAPTVPATATAAAPTVPATVAATPIVPAVSCEAMVEHTPAGHAIVPEVAATDSASVETISGPSASSEEARPAKDTTIPIAQTDAVLGAVDPGLTPDSNSVEAPRRNTLTAEWLLLLTYALTVYLSNPLTVNYGIFAALFCGVPAAVWFVYLLMETKSESRLNAAN